MAERRRRIGDRKDGRLLRSLPAYHKLLPFFMPNREDACNLFEERLEIGVVDRYLRRLRAEGYKGIGFLHFLIAAYIRCCSMLPGLNRFVCGRHSHAAKDVTVVPPVKRSLSLDARESSIKLHFAPTDTILDVYRKMNDKIEELKINDASPTEAIAEILSHFPRFLLRFLFALLRMMDYHGWLPLEWEEASPYHSSVAITDLGSLRLRPAFRHLPHFGTTPVSIAFGAKSHSYEINRRGQAVHRKYIDIRLVLDERIVDGHYYAQFRQAFRYLLRHPEILEKMPGRVIDDVF